jgi:hypothetical protein
MLVGGGFSRYHADSEDEKELFNVRAAVDETGQLGVA